jgi:hypothetical protein
MSKASQPGNGERTDKPHRRRWRTPVILWAVFAMGLLVQAFAPRLKIENGAFVIPEVLTSGSLSTAPAEIVARERRLRTLSAALTLTGALGLAYYYRGRLIKRPS